MVWHSKALCRAFPCFSTDPLVRWVFDKTGGQADRRERRVSLERGCEREGEREGEREHEQRSWSVSLKAWERTFRTRKWRMGLGKRERCGTAKSRGVKKNKNQCQYRSVPIPRQARKWITRCLGTLVGFKPSSDRITKVKYPFTTKDPMTKEACSIHQIKHNPHSEVCGTASHSASTSRTWAYIGSRGRSGGFCGLDRWMEDWKAACLIPPC
jgi:hypothetical protein